MVRLVSSFALAILLLATLGDMYKHTFHMYGKINCPRKWFWYRIKLTEIDSGEQWYGEADVDSFYPHYYDQTWSQEDGDQGSSYYELKLTFFHTCTATGEFATKTYEFPNDNDNVYVYGEDHTFELEHDMDLYS